MKAKVKHLIVACIAIGLIAPAVISCDEDEEGIVPNQVPTLTTTAIFNITENAATSGGNISDNYNSPVTVRGVCWGTDPTPNLSGNKTVDGLGIGPFESNLTGLSPGQTYYVRAYATNTAGTGYGSSLPFTTLENQGQVPALTTAAVTGITTNSAISGGNISSDNGASVTARGVCWSNSPTPTISDNKTIDGTGIGGFQSNITGLSANQTYYVRAYATNATGTGYGSALQFLTIEGGGFTVTDADGNTYNTLTIGNQVWTVENLKTTRYNDGTDIPNITNNTQWGNIATGAYCNYDNLESNVATYGRLYNWAAVNTGKLAPPGWHVPTEDDLEILENYLIANGYNYDGTLVLNKIAKSLCAKTNWILMSEVGTPGYEPETNNSSGFTALPGGIRYTHGGFANLGQSSYFWSSTEKSEIGADYRALTRNYVSFWSLGEINKNSGVSVRLIKD
jgi:uncharacterized protein (TIGR02145 family)